MFSQAELGLDPLDKYQEVEREYRQSLDSGEPIDDGSVGWGHLALAWAVEKQGRGEEAIREAEIAKSHLSRANDPARYSEACHSLGVWRFHHSDDEGCADELLEAAVARRSNADYLGCAQSWHNLGYVRLRFGHVAKARSAYEEALRFLVLAEKDENSTVRAAAFRQRGFVFSHLAYVEAKHGTTEAAIDAITVYANHFHVVGVHREPVMVYCAAALTVARLDVGDRSARKAVSMLTKTPAQVPQLFDFTVRDAELAMTSLNDTGTGRRAYLGAWILALSEAASWYLNTRQFDVGESLRLKAITLARARGWKAEAVRASRVGQEATGDAS